MNDIRRSVAIKLQNLMDEKNISQTELANQTGIAQATISNLLPGMDDEKQHPATSYENILALAKFFGVSVDWLLGYSKYKTTTQNIKITAETTGLSENAVDKLASMNDKGVIALPLVINALLSYDEGINVLVYLAEFFFTDFSQIYTEEIDDAGNFTAVSHNRVGFKISGIKQPENLYQFHGPDHFEYSVLSLLNDAVKHLKEKMQSEH